MPHDDHRGDDEQDTMARVQRAIARALKEEGIDATLVGGGLVNEDGEVVAAIPLDDDDGDVRMSKQEIETTVRDLAEKHGRGDAFNEVSSLFDQVEREHENTTKGQDVLAAIDKLQVGQPLREFFTGGVDKASANAKVESLIVNGDLKLLMDFMFELGAVCELFPELRKMLAKRLAGRVASQVTGAPISASALAALQQLQSDKRFRRSLDDLAAVQDAQKRAGGGKGDKPDCPCPKCTARREHERTNLN